jgi:hypothetical protein
VGVVVRSMHALRQAAVVQKWGSHVLFLMSLTSIGVEQLADANAVTTEMHALSCIVDTDPDTAHHCLRVITAVLDCCDKGRSFDVLDHVCGALTHPALQRILSLRAVSLKVCGLTARVCAANPTRPHVDVTKATLAILFTEMNTHDDASDGVDVQVAALQSLSLLLAPTDSDSEAVSAICSYGGMQGSSGVDAVVACCLRSPGNVAIQIAGGKVLATLAKFPLRQESLVARGCLDVVSAALKQHGDVVNVIVPALQALGSLCHLRAAQSCVMDSLATIITCGEQHCVDPAVVSAVCDLFRMISRASSGVLVSAGVPRLLEVMLTRARVAGDNQVVATVETLLQELSG